MMFFLETVNALSIIFKFLSKDLTVTFCTPILIKINKRNINSILFYSYFYCIKKITNRVWCTLVYSSEYHKELIAFHNHSNLLYHHLLLLIYKLLQLASLSS